MANRSRPERREPTFGQDYDAQERAERRAAARRPAKKKKRRRRSSLLGPLVRGCLLLGLWSGIALGGVVAYEAA